eukprot:scaffold137742_cov22-Cyclotella_meneghiniana.AAC.1
MSQNQGIFRESDASSGHFNGTRDSPSQDVSATSHEHRSNHFTAPSPANRNHNHGVHHSSAAAAYPAAASHQNNAGSAADARRSSDAAADPVSSTAAPSPAADDAPVSGGPPHLPPHHHQSVAAPSSSAFPAVAYHLHGTAGHNEHGLNHSPAPAPVAAAVPSSTVPSAGFNNYAPSRHQYHPSVAPASTSAFHRQSAVPTYAAGGLPVGFFSPISNSTTSGPTVDRFGNSVGVRFSDPWSQPGGDSFHADVFRSPSAVTSPGLHMPWGPPGHAAGLSGLAGTSLPPSDGYGLPPSGSRLFPNAQAPPPRSPPGHSYGRGAAASPPQAGFGQGGGHYDDGRGASAPSAAVSPSRGGFGHMFSRSGALVPRDDRGQTAKDVMRTHSSAVKPLSSDSWLQALTFEHSADPLKIAAHYSDTELVLQEIKDRCTKYDMFDPFVLWESFDFNSGSVFGDPIDVFDAAPRLSPALICSWIDFARPRWTQVDMESDDWAQEFFLSCLTPELRREVKHETKDFSPAHYCALSIAWVTMRKVFSGTFEHFGTLEQVIIKFDIHNYPAQNVIKASEYISAASRALRTIGRIPGQCLQSILEGMRQSDCNDFNLRCSALMVRPDMSSYSVYGASSDDLFRRIRSLLTETSSWYTGYLQVGKWPAAQSSLAAPSSLSTFSTTSVDPRFIQQVVA